MIDPRWIGHELPRHIFEIERGRLKLFAKVVGETNPIYLDEVAARAHGHPDLPALPSFLFAAELDTGSLTEMLGLLGIDMGRILHGEQRFTHHGMVYANDTISVTSCIANIYQKKNGALEFIAKETFARNQRNQCVAELRATLVVRS